MTDWKQKLAARMAGPSDGKPDEPAAAGPVAPAWARVAGDRAAGNAPSQDDVDEARERARRPRTEFERKILERLGHDGAPPAA